MDFKKVIILLPAIVLMSQGVFAAPPGQDFDPHDQQQPQDYPPQYGQNCDRCAPFNPAQDYVCSPGCARPPVALRPYYPAPPPPPPPPDCPVDMVFDAYGRAYCPPPPQVTPYYYGQGPVYQGPVVTQPIYRGGWYGRRGEERGWYGRGGGDGNRLPLAVVPGNNYPRVTPYYGRGGGGGQRNFHRSSLEGCEVRQNNNGEFEVISAKGTPIFRRDTEDAQEKAELMKVYYQNSNTGLCGGTDSSAKVQDI
jgi:hypothetical protein